MFHQSAVPWDAIASRSLRLLVMALIAMTSYGSASSSSQAQVSEQSEQQAAGSEQELLNELDRALLEDLGGELPEPARRSTTEPNAGSLEPGVSGEDIGQPSESDPLQLIAQHMQTVEARIASHDTAEETQRLQQTIVAELARLIEQMQQQGSGGGSASQSQQAASRSSEGAQQAGHQPAQNSTTRRGTSDPTSQEQAEAMQRSMKDVWGHLPERVRERMRSAPIDQFLPKYEKLIEAYYQRLAEGETP